MAPLLDAHDVAIALKCDASIPSGTPGFVYFFEAVGCGRVKIGWSVNVDARQSELQTGCPFPLRKIGYGPGSLADERALHRRFAAQRVSPSTEWFHLTSEIAGYAGALEARYVCAWCVGERKEVKRRWWQSGSRAPTAGHERAASLGVFCT